MTTRFGRSNDHEGRGLAALCLAVGGVFAGHWLTYLVVRVDGVARRQLLAVTGHGYLSATTRVAWMVGLVAAAGIFLGRLERRQEPTPSVGPLARDLWVLLITAFAVQEILERTVTGSFAGLLPVLVVGATAMVFIAIAIAAVVRGLLWAADRAREALGRARPSPLPTAAVVVPRAPLFPQAPVLLAGTIRAPPSDR